MLKIDFKNWSFIRGLRLVMMMFITFQAIESQNWWMLLLSAVLFYQVVINPACGSCQTGACEIPKKKATKEV
jgi:hypothetical protein